MKADRLAEIRRLRRQRIAKMEDEGPREICNLGCQQETGVWHVPDEIWATVTGDAVGSYCLRCFDKLAEAQGILLFWEAREGHYPTDSKYLLVHIADWIGWHRIVWRWRRIRAKGFPLSTPQEL